MYSLSCVAFRDEKLETLKKQHIKHWVEYLLRWWRIARWTHWGKPQLAKCCLLQNRHHQRWTVYNSRVAENTREDTCFAQKLFRRLNAYETENNKSPDIAMVSFFWCFFPACLILLFCVFRFASFLFEKSSIFRTRLEKRAWIASSEAGRARVKT